MAIRMPLAVTTPIPVKSCSRTTIPIPTQPGWNWNCEPCPDASKLRLRLRNNLIPNFQNPPKSANLHWILTHVLSKRKQAIIRWAADAQTNYLKEILWPRTKVILSMSIFQDYTWCSQNLCRTQLTYCQISEAKTWNSTKKVAAGGKRSSKSHQIWHRQLITKGRLLSSSWNKNSPLSSDARFWSSSLSGTVDANSSLISWDKSFWPVALIQKF